MNMRIQRKDAKTQRHGECPLAVGSTRVSRVQFGVPPNCYGTGTTITRRAIAGNWRWQSVSGATPETTRETRVLHHDFLRFGVSAIQKN
jgi:hypothetical protein